MRKLAPLVAAATLCSVLFGISAVAAENRQKLTGPQIRTRFAGRQLTDEVHFRDIYERDSTLRSYSMGMKRVGKWAIEKDELCLYLGEADNGCYEVLVSGERIEMKPVGLGLTIEGVLQAPADRN